MARAAKGGGAERGSSEEEAGEAAPPAEPAEVAEYVASMAAELAVLARSSKLDFVAQLLDMAREAAAEAAGIRPNAGR